MSRTPPTKLKPRRLGRFKADGKAHGGENQKRRPDDQRQRCREQGKRAPVRSWRRRDQNRRPIADARP